MTPEQITTQTEIMTAQVLTRDIAHKASRLDNVRKSLTEFNQKRDKIPPRIESAPEVKSEPPKVTTQVKAKHDPREPIILNWAKEHYQSYPDIQKFPFDNYRDKECRITAGVVYLCLRKHSFIKQNETTEYRVMDAYFRQNGRLADIAHDTGLKVWIVAKTIERLGFPPKWQEYRDSRYMTSTNQGIGGEALFKKLVPNALDCNEEIRECNPHYDFIVDGKTVDVKEFAPINRRGRSHWLFRPSHRIEDDLADFYCLFLAKDKEKRLDGEYHCLLVPKEVLQIGKQEYNISTNPKNGTHQFFFQFEIDPTALSLMLSDEL